MSIAKWLLAKKLGGGSPFPPVIKRKTGNPIEFSDGADAPLVKCTTEIQGSQDLHGYDKPWVGGAGKNKLPLVLSDIKSQNTSGTWSGNIYTLNGGTFEVTVDSDGNVTNIIGSKTAAPSIVLSLTFALPSGSYILSSGFEEVYGSNDTLIVKDGVTIARGNSTSPGPNFTLSEDSTITWNFRISSVTRICTPMIRLSTESNPVFMPYSNICPITAYTEGEIEVRGKNLADISTFEVGTLAESSAVGSTYASCCQASTIRFRSSDVIDAKNRQVTVSCANGYNVFILLFDANKFYTGNFQSWNTSITFTSPYIGIIVRRVDNGTITSSDYDNCKLMLNIGSSAENYEKFRETTHTTTYPSVIYRGSEDCVNMEIEAEWGYSKGGTRGSIDSSGKLYKIVDLNGSEFTQAGGVANMISSHFPVLSLEGARAANYPSICKYGITVYVGGFVGNENTLDTLLPDLEIAYKLATPTTSSVTPTNLPIKSIAGYSHIESTTGEMVVDYITDAYQNFVDTVESALPNTTRNLLNASKGGVKAMDIFLSLEKKDNKEEEVKEETKDDMR